ncbi:prenyltransferase [Adlercreutzia sp. R21]|uniref:prenyltransferase n=1 Tax=Adlercreutzia wanghongyangiae TaxID=3111451 RepID=UPI002DB8D7A8|nr:prenyltransferase [Adlercreutzia sp. R21]MEC4184122.1 prenyltransferase [Adlercreutzia sp. R21]
MCTEQKITERGDFAPLSPRLAWQLAAIHTWPASIMPVLVAVACAANVTGRLSPLLTLVLLLICILMQASVNTFNDYFDYVKGADSADDNVEASDAVLVYNQVNPRSALALAIGFLIAAFCAGLYVIWCAGFTPLVIAAVGAVIVVAYSGGKTPLSYLPVGEAVSGIVMGGLIPLACYQVLTGCLDFIALVWAVPTIIGVGLIMMTNNTCDIEKDIEAGRRTLPVLLGRSRARAVYHGLMVAWVAAIAVIAAIWFPRGAIVLPFMLLAAYPLMAALWKNPLAPPTRIGAMGQIGSVNVALGAFYAAALFV